MNVRTISNGICFDKQPCSDSSQLCLEEKLYPNATNYVVSKCPNYEKKLAAEKPKPKTVNE
jgi:hypothetical protein